MTLPPVYMRFLLVDVAGRIARCDLETVFSPEIEVEVGLSGCGMLDDIGIYAQCISNQGSAKRLVD